MTELCKSDDPACLRRALEIIGDKYSALILRFLHDGPKRFKDFEESIEGISPRTLSQRLAMLEMRGITTKTTCPESPGRSQYELTQAGIDLDLVLHSMAAWGTKYAKDLV